MHALESPRKTCDLYGTKNSILAGLRVGDIYVRYICAHRWIRSDNIVVMEITVIPMKMRGRYWKREREREGERDGNLEI